MACAGVPDGSKRHETATELAAWRLMVAMACGGHNDHNGACACHEASSSKLRTNTALRSPVNPARLDTLHPDSNMGLGAQFYVGLEQASEPVRCMPCKCPRVDS